MVFSGKAPLPIVSKSLSSSKIKFLDLDPLEVARQFTLMESKIFNQIQHSECIGKAWSTPEVRTVAPNIKELIERANKVFPFFLLSFFKTYINDNLNNNKKK